MEQGRMDSGSQGEEWEPGSQQLAPIAAGPQTNPGDFSKVTQASVSKKLKPSLLCYRVLTAGLSYAITGRKWL